MAVKITVYSTEKIITGCSSKDCTKSPTGQIRSDGAETGHEWEEHVAIEVDLEPSVLASPNDLHYAINNYQAIVTNAVRSQLKAKGALIDGDGNQAAPPAQVPAKGTWGNTALPAQTAPTKAKAAAPAPEPEDESQDEEEQGPPPKNGSQLFAWAAKHSSKGKALVYEAWSQLEYKGKIMAADEKKLFATWKRAQKMLAEGWDQ